MFTIDFGITPLTDITGLQFTDKSTSSGERVESRTIDIIKPDLTDTSYSFPDNVVTSISPTGFLDKDYALEATFTVVTNLGTYTKTLRFVTLGYSITARKARIKRDKVDQSILDKETYHKNTLELNYYSLAANDRVAAGDMVGAQQALDYIADIITKEALSPFSN